jgi:IclR family acetate operon transcriptional repressor
VVKIVPAGAGRSGLARADAILGAFDGAHPALPLAAIVAKTGLPKTTVLRAVEKMRELGWLEHEGDRYSIGERLGELATRPRLRGSVRVAAAPFLQDLAEVIGASVHLAMREHDHVFDVERISRPRPGTAAVDPSGVGDRLPAHCTASGKVLLAFAPSHVVETVMASRLEARTAVTITALSRLRAELNRIRSEGLGYEREECRVGMVAVAAPLFGPDGSCVAAVSVTGPTLGLRLDRAAPAVRAAALGASRALRNATG